MYGLPYSMKAWMHYCGPNLAHSLQYPRTIIATEASVYHVCLAHVVMGKDAAPAVWAKTPLREAVPQEHDFRPVLVCGSTHALRELRR